jgi:murein L,D-transpeptidase YafK
MRWFNLIFSVFVLLGLAALAYILIWMPPNDADAFALTRERAARHQAYRLHQPLPGADPTAETLEARLARTGFKLGQPIFMRIYKLEFEAEVWMQRDGRYTLFAKYPICTFSGQLGPKMRSLDRQSPEGIYEVTAGQLNPHSRWHKAFNLGFPNAFDKANGRTGSYLMVHGGCSSIGCYAMTNPAVDDLFILAKAALTAGQTSFQVQALPFRMTAEALAARSAHASAAFWSELKPIVDVFDQTLAKPDVVVCDGHYRLAEKTASRTGRAAPPPTGCKKI